MEDIVFNTVPARAAIAALMARRAVGSAFKVSESWISGVQTLEVDPAERAHHVSRKNRSRDALLANELRVLISEMISKPTKRIS